MRKWEFLLCPAEFLDFGPEILTRDLAQAPQDTQSWTLFFFFFQPTYGRPNVFPDPQIGKKCTKMFFFFCVHLCVSWWARAQSRVKSSTSNSQNWAGHSDIGKIMASWPAQLVTRSFWTRILLVLSVLVNTWWMQRQKQQRQASGLYEHELSTSWARVALCWLARNNEVCCDSNHTVDTQLCKPRKSY